MLSVTGLFPVTETGPRQEHGQVYLFLLLLQHLFLNLCFSKAPCVDLILACWVPNCSSQKQAPVPSPFSHQPQILHACKGPPFSSGAVAQRAWLPHPCEACLCVCCCLHLAAPCVPHTLLPGFPLGKCRAGHLTCSILVYWSFWEIYRTHMHWVRNPFRASTHSV